MRNGWSWIGWGVVLGLMNSLVWGAEPDPEAVRRLMEKYEREAAEEAAKPGSVPAIDYDHEAWKAATECGTAACFRAYLEDYPKGRYARMARARLEPKSESESRPKAVERPSPPSRPAQALLADRYRDHGDGTVTDVKTSLQWMRCSLGQTWRGGTCNGELKGYDWQATMDAAKLLNGQSGYAGYHDWRVPTKEELKSLIYCSSSQSKNWNDTNEKCEGSYQRPTIYQPAFPNMPPKWYWSSSVYNNDRYHAWGVYFNDGGVLAIHWGVNGRVLLVRGGR